MKKLIVLALAVLAVAPFAGMAQDVNTNEASDMPKTLFPYPVAPDTIKTFENRVNYIVPRFWDKYDLSKPITDLAAFDGAFRDYLGFMRYCHKNVAISSVRDFIFKAQSNMGNFEKIVKLADQDLYQVGAEYWSDDLYSEFLKGAVKNKAMSNESRKYYSKQMERINRTQLGGSMAEVDFLNLDGKTVQLKDIEADMLFVYISKDADSDHSFERVRLSTDVNINNMLADGRVKLLCISPEKYNKTWAKNALEYSDKWIVGTCEDLSTDGLYDVRFLPSFIVLDKEKNIIQKNVGLEALKAVFER
ncbi:MAG: DUF5106 domain-containing protein [Muribaculaceae bacterium]